MAYQVPIKYFNAFWLKKVVGSENLTPYEELSEWSGGPGWFGESTVTTSTKGGSPVELEYKIPTWPSIPWSNELTKPFYGNDPDEPQNDIQLPYPVFPWGGRLGNGSFGATSGPPEARNGVGSLLNGALSENEEQGRELNWGIEESRIEGGFNNTSVDYGAKAYAVEDDNLQKHRFNSLIYSGIYNNRTGYNNTNMFSTAEPITKSVDPENGSIQKLYAYDTNLTIFQENKVSKALIDKDAIYSAEGVGTPVTSTKVVIGQIVPYVGEFGISRNPESWAQYGFRQYFSDKFRNSIMRLSRDGLTEISNYGMTDFFRDELSTLSDFPVKATLGAYDVVQPNELPEDFIIRFVINNIEDCDCDLIPIGSLLQVDGNALQNLFVVDVSSFANNSICQVTTSKAWTCSDFNLSNWPEKIEFIYYKNDTIIGGFDTHNKNYVMSIQAKTGIPACTQTPPFREHNGYTTNSYNTLNFDESINGWVSFYSYVPTLMGSIKNEFYTVDKRKLYKHYDGGEENYLTFYDTTYKGSIEFIFNPNPSVSKNFQTVSYEGNNGWQVEYFISDQTAKFLNLFTGQYYGFSDSSNEVLSISNGEYTNPDTGYPDYAGFKLKENKYVANLVNNSSINPGEVLSSEAMSGIKGYYSTVKLITDGTTDITGVKELYAVSSKWVVSSK